ncbi:CHAP domain-containing protein [Microbacterium sp. NPDC096154]|uniref:CHAP domain-containing protein n=1 Tax=Microbacterium sp. NPDC096154 TaxID=3155549 RepID=UPI00331F994D
MSVVEQRVVARRGRPVATLLAALALVVSLLAAATPAQAITWGPKLCDGFRACAAQGRSDAGYEAVYRQSFWNMTAGHNCTNYVAYRMQKAGIARFVRAGYGFAYQWGSEARRAGLVVDKGTPRVGDVAWWDRDAIGGSGLGHVAYVESVDVKAGTFTVSEDNYSADYDWRVYRISEVSGFIRVAKPAPSAKTLTAPVPTVGGTVAVGASLTAKPGTWGPAPVTLAYQWLRNGAAITGATTPTYRVTVADGGAKLAVRVTGSKTGYTTAAKTSTAVTVPRPALTAPVPTVGGTVAVGASLTAKPGTWGPAPVTLAYQWLRNGAAITGATAPTYRVTVADGGAKLAVRVTGGKTGYTTAAKTSTAVTVPRPALTAPVPTVGGTLRVGSTLSATAGKWAPSGVALTYQWLRNGSPIAGATARTYRLTRADVGKTVTVRVTGTLKGYPTTVRISRAAGPVKP